MRGKAALENVRAMHVSKELAAHPNVLLFDRPVFDQDNITGELALVYECCNAGDLRRLVRIMQHNQLQLSRVEVLTIANQLCDGLRALKKANIVHGDVALRNVFLSVRPDSLELI